MIAPGFCMPAPDAVSKAVGRPAASPALRPGAETAPVRAALAASRDDRPEFSRIRRAGTGERALLATLHLSALWLIDMQAHPQEAIAAFARKMPGVDTGLIARDAYFVAEEDGGIRGGAGWAPLDESLRPDDFVDAQGQPAGLRWTRNTALLGGLFDDGQAGGRAVRRRLVRHVAADAARAGYGMLEAFAPEHSAPGCREAGLHPIHRLGLRLAGGRILPVVHLRRALVSEMAALA